MTLTTIKELENKNNILLEDSKKLNNLLERQREITMQIFQELHSIEASKNINQTTMRAAWHIYKKNKLDHNISFLESQKFLFLTHNNQIKRAWNLHTECLAIRNKEGDDTHFSKYKEIEKIQDNIGKLRRYNEALLSEILNITNHYTSIVERLSSDTTTRPYQEKKSFWKKLFG